MSKILKSEQIKNSINKGEYISLPEVLGRIPGKQSKKFKRTTPARPNCLVVEKNDEGVVLKSPTGKLIRLKWSSFNSNKWAGPFIIHQTKITII